MPMLSNPKRTPSLTVIRPPHTYKATQNTRSNTNHDHYHEPIIPNKINLFLIRPQTLPQGVHVPPLQNKCHNIGHELHISSISNMKITPQIFGDDRGFFMETYHHDKFLAAGISEHLCKSIILGPPKAP